MLKICRKTVANQTPEQAAAKKITKNQKTATTANPKHLLVMMIAVLSVFHASLL
jgi:hypothetical protein